MLRFLIIFLSFLFVPLNSYPEIYKCFSKDGVATFSDEPCPNKGDVFIKTPQIDVDVVIEEAIPFVALSSDEDSFYDRLVEHAERVGKCFLPDEHYNNYKIDSRIMDSWSCKQYIVALYYGPPSKEAKWSIILRYIGKSEKLSSPCRNPVFFLDSIDVCLWGKNYDTPKIKIQALRKQGTGYWKRNKDK